MESRAKALGHAIHPMLIVFPLGLLSTAALFDVLWLITGRDGLAIAAAYLIITGVIAGPIAGVFGLLDWLKIPGGTRARRVGLLHAVVNVVALLLFFASWLVRVGAENWEPSAFALVCSFVGVAVATTGGWLGGELVERHGIGVHEGASLDAPSSLLRS